jgi:Icc-related predicted phosphoesterase
MINVCAISDIHGNLVDVPKCDLLLICGDLSPTHNHNVTFQASWINTNFKNWINNIEAKEIVYIAGNHDFVFQEKKHLIEFDKINGTYLEDSGVNLFGLNIYGTPHQPVYYDWSFNLTEPELEKKWALIPNDTNILVTHGPPLGYGDLTDRGERVGSWTLANRIKDLALLKLHTFGHIHSDRGQWHLNSATLANVTVLDERYKVAYPPMLFSVES